MDFRSYYSSLDKEAKAAYAKRAGTSCEYIQLHLLPRRKIPRRPTMENLAAASNGACTYEDMVSYFMLNAA